MENQLFPKVGHTRSLVSIIFMNGCLKTPGQPKLEKNRSDIHIQPAVADHSPLSMLSPFSCYCSILSITHLCSFPEADEIQGAEGRGLNLVGQAIIMLDVAFVVIRF